LAKHQSQASNLSQKTIKSIISVSLGGHTMRKEEGEGKDAVMLELEMLLQKMGK
jgi:hypothetical protein